jgi:signal transduction histidine kinase
MGAESPNRVANRAPISWRRSLRVRAFVVVVLAWWLPIAFVAFVTSSDGTVAQAVRAHVQSELARLSLALSPVALLLAWWLSARTVRPIELLRAQVLAKATSGSTREGELALHRRDEIDDLAASFNALLRTLDERRVANESFAADLVHALKTPLATIRAAADAIERGGVDGARGARLATAMRDSTRRLDGLAVSFLALARADAGMPNELREPVDLAALARAIAHASIADGGLEGRSIEVVASDRVVVIGVAARLEDVVRNLVDNALSFAGARVTVTLVRDVTGARLVVEDDGPGLAEDVRRRVFDRFFTTRSRDRDGGGTGLGLALVRAIVEAHGGEVSATNRPDGGARFEAHFPD